MERRNFLKSSLMTAGALTLGNHVFANQAPAQAIERASSCNPVPQFGDYANDCLSAYIYDSPDSAVWIRWKNQILTCYRAEAKQKYPYFFPLRALKSGLSLTSETSHPWPHHRSVFFALDRVNGANFWQNNPDKDRIVSQKLELGECTEKSAEIFNECLWTPFEKEPLIADKRRYLITILDENTYTLDSYLELTALTELTCEKTNHGLFGVRLERDLSAHGGGVLLNSEGEQYEADLYNKPARWITAYGRRYGRDDGLVEGVAIMSPPYKRTPFDRSTWFARNYGNFSPMPFDFPDANEKIIISKNETIKLAYRIVAFTGTPDNAFLNAHWDEFKALSEGKRS